MTDGPVSINDQPVSTSLTLLQRVQRNEQDAWQLLVELYAPMIYARCRNQWQMSPNDAENIGQEVFTAIARKIGDFQRQRTGSFRAWLRTITDNKCRDYLRKNIAANGNGGSAQQQLLENVTDETDATDNDTEELLGEKALVMRQAMKAVENEFSARDWRIFWAIEVQGKDRQDVAEDLGVSTNVVYLVCSRIRKRMKERFEDLIDDNLIDENQIEDETTGEENHPSA